MSDALEAIREASAAPPALCTRCQHPSHAGQTCTVAFALRNVYGTPKLPCIRCGPGTQEEGDDDDRA